MNLKLKSSIIICLITLISCSIDKINNLKKKCYRSHQSSNICYKKRSLNFCCKKGYILPTMVSFFLLSSYMLFPDKGIFESQKFDYNLNFIGNKDNNDWFTERNWNLYLDQINHGDNEMEDDLLLNNLQRIDNICRYKDGFKVFDESNIFQFDDVSPIDLFGNEGDYNSQTNNKVIYEKIFKSTLWKKEEFFKANWALLLNYRQIIISFSH